MSLKSNGCYFSIALPAMSYMNNAGKLVELAAINETCYTTTNTEEAKRECFLKLMKTLSESKYFEHMTHELYADLLLIVKYNVNTSM